MHSGVSSTRPAQWPPPRLPRAFRPDPMTVLRLPSSDTLRVGGLQVPCPRRCASKPLTTLVTAAAPVHARAAPREYVACGRPSARAPGAHHGHGVVGGTPPHHGSPTTIPQWVAAVSAPPIIIIIIIIIIITATAATTKQQDREAKFQRHGKRRLSAARTMAEPQD